MQAADNGQAAPLPGVIARLGTALLAVDGDESPARVDALAQAAGVSPRTLHRLCVRHWGAPPVALMRRARMQGVRRSLQAPGPTDTVTSLAFDWGFFHLGRFAASYKACFGEHPSETLRRGRQVPGACVDSAASRTWRRRRATGNGWRTMPWADY
jgi:methylphosphotriester-DNA--protein-cysteine methyltransferase